MSMKSARKSVGTVQKTTIVGTCASDLKQVVFFEFLENAALDFDELVGYEQSEESVVVGVDGDIERD